MKQLKSKLTKIIAATLIAVTVLSIASPILADARWRQQGGRWWYELTSTTWATGWRQIGGTWYFFDSAGWMQTGWVNDSGTWYFMRPSGAMATGWVNDRGTWYFMGPSGAMVTGWVDGGGTWYWMHPNGAMATGTVTIGGERHTFAADGRWTGGGSVTGGGTGGNAPGGGGANAPAGGTTATHGNWRQEGGRWWFALTATTWATGWTQIGGTWYFFDNDGWMQTGWVHVGGDVFFMNPSGAMATGWVEIGNHYYFFHGNGTMARGVVTIDGVRRTFAADGRFLEQSAISPLTGLPIPQNMANRRPLAISLGNAPLATMPLNGVSRADIIYEVPLQGNVTRIIALFQDTSNLPQIGSVRSARYYIAQIARSHNAILVSVGGNFLSEETIEREQITWINANAANRGQMFTVNQGRIPGRTLDPYISRVTSGELINRHLPNFGFTLTHNFNNRLSFVDNATPSGGTATNNVNIRFTPSKTSTFTFDSARGVYHMRQAINGNNRDFIDANNGAQVEFTNLIILRTDVTASDDPRINEVGADRLRVVRTTGSGTGYFVNGGRRVPINWSRADYEAPFVYTLQNGTPLNLGRGTTYVAFVPLQGQGGNVTW